MTVAALRDRIGEQATANLMPVLLERMSLHHRERWRDCDCEWCNIKRQATRDIALSPLHLHGRIAREERRANLRAIYRQRMALAFAK